MRSIDRLGVYPEFTGRDLKPQSSGSRFPCAGGEPLNDESMETKQSTVSSEDQTAIIGHLETLIADSSALMAQTHLAPLAPLLNSRGLRVGSA